MVDKLLLQQEAARRSVTNADQAAFVRRMDVRELLGDRREILLVHGGREYRLRLTSNGKLILTA